MSLTSSQAVIFKAAVTSDATVSSFVTAHDWPSIAKNYNANVTTVVWKPQVPAYQIMASILPKDYNALTGNAPIGIVAMLTGGFIDATQANVQSWFSTMFSSAAATTTINNLVAVSQRNATKLENLYVVSSVSSVFGTVLTGNDVQTAMGF